MHHAHHQDNPFFNRQRITDPAYFVGRKREIEALYSAIATRQCRSIVGERKIGKSSLLTHLSCPDTLKAHGFDPAHYIFLYVDLEGMATITYSEFWPELLDRLELALPEDQDELRQQASDLALSSSVRFMQVRRLFRRIDRAGLIVVLMLDEFESLAINGHFTASFYGELRSLAGELGVVYLTASKRSLYDLTYQHADTLSSPFFNIFSEEPLGLLPSDEGVALLSYLSAMFDEAQAFSQEQIDFLVDLAGSHPFFLQVAGFYLYRAYRQVKRPMPTAAQINERVVYHFKAEAEDHFRYLWHQLSESEQSVLLHLKTADITMKKKLMAKALLQVDNDSSQMQPFSQAFADFLSRTTPLERPSFRQETSITHLTGSTLGSYRVLSTVGRGGMAVVYKGYQASLDRYVAIKVISRLLADDQTFVDRFQREAASIAQLHHQNIVQMYDFGIHQEISYMVMEYIEGETLKQRLSRLRGQNERIPLPEVVKILQDIAAALNYAHAHGIIHRDVKPANIMLRQEDRLARLTGTIPFSGVLTDFGVARMLEGIQLTGTGATIGTPDYMSPEQARGEPAEAASDIYALGIILYEMLTGELPFTADTPVALLLKHMHDDPPSVVVKVPDLPVQLEPVVVKALAKNPKERFATAGQLAHTLAQAVERGV